MKTWPKHPVIYEINTWVWLCELTRKHKRSMNLATVPEQEWDVLAAYGFDAVWFWECGNGARPELQSPCKTRDFLRISGEPFLTLPRRIMSGRPIVFAATLSTSISVEAKGLR
jgi:hypothetical protein